MDAPATTEETTMITTERRFMPPMAARDDGERAMSQVLSHNLSWKDMVMDAIFALPFATKGTFEDFRNKVVGTAGEPGHPNAWGAVANALIRQGYLQDTGEVAHMTSKRSHGRKSAVLFRTSKV